MESLQTRLSSLPFTITNTSHYRRFPNPITRNYFLNNKHKFVCANIITTKRSGNNNNNNNNFLDMKPEPVDHDIALTTDEKSRPVDVVVVGTGPAGLRMAEQASSRGVRVLCVDPAPLAAWRNNYAVWADEFESLGLAHCLHKIWPRASVFLGEGKSQRMDRPYARVCRKKLKAELLRNCVSNGVRFHKAKVSKMEHGEFESVVWCSDGKEIKTSLVVDATGSLSSFVEYDKPRKSHGYQIAHGILAEVESHPFESDEMVFMDWRDSHLKNNPELCCSNFNAPTFLYAMPHLGIKVNRVLEDEQCFNLLGGPLPRMGQSVMAIGGSPGEIHPTTGFMLAKSMASAPAVAAEIADCLETVRGKRLYRRAWNCLWPYKKRCEREAYSFGMETLSRLDLDGTRRIFDAFLDIDPKYYHGFLSSSLTLGELAFFAMDVFVRASPLAKLDISTKCPPLALRMMGNIALENLNNS